MAVKYRILTIGLAIVLFSLLYMAFSRQPQTSAELIANPWVFRSVDTMKYSRDMAVSNVNDPLFDSEIEAEVKNIADTGATHVAIATPYDEEFVPFLKRWVDSARKHHLKVWFRGNWSSWEGWFGRDKNMTFDDHIQKSVDFIKNHSNLFEDGDAFTACPECENGAQGDPRETKKVAEYRQFLIDEHTKTQQAFTDINKKVNTSLLSMNKDVADLVMDEATAKAVGGFVTIDHYVGEAKKVARDVDALAAKTHAQIVLGEFGAPIPDLNGDMTEDEQAKWIDEALGELLKSKNLYGVSYWINKGGSTALWREDNSPRKAAATLTHYFAPTQFYGKITDEYGNAVDNVTIEANGRYYNSQNGEYLVPVYNDQTVNFTKEGYQTKSVSVGAQGREKQQNIIFSQKNPNIFYSWWIKIRRAFLANG